MSTRLQQAQLIQSESFLLQLSGSLLAAAAQIINEASDAANHTNRLAYARAIIASPAPIARFMAPGIMLNSTIASEAGGANGESGTPIPDGDLDFVVASIFNVYADQYVSQFNIGPTLNLGSL